METNFKSISDTYVHHGGVASVIQLDTKLLKSEIEKDDVKIIKLFEIMSNRMIILNPQKLFMFRALTVEKIRLFCKMCQVKIYRNGEEIDVKNGGIILKGTLELKEKKIMNMLSGLKNAFGKGKNTSIMTPSKLAEAAGLSLSPENKDEKKEPKKQTTESLAATKKQLEKQKQLKSLGEFFKKTIEVEHHEQQNKKKAVSFIYPDDKSNGYVAICEDYVIVMHFNESLKGRIIDDGQILDENELDEAFHEFNQNFKRRNLQNQSLKMQSKLRDLKHGRTIMGAKPGEKDTRNMFLALGKMDKATGSINSNKKNNMKEYIKSNT